MFIDLHLYTKNTPDATLEPGSLIDRAKQMGLDGIAITDHNTVAGVEEAKRAGLERDFPVFGGLEVLTTRGRFLVFLPDYRIADPLSKWLEIDDLFNITFEKLLEKVTAANGVLIAARPYDRDLPNPMGDALFTMKGIHGVEVLNSQCKQAQNDLALEAALRLELPCLGGSNCVTDLKTLGGYATLFKTPIKNEEELVAAIRNGDVWAATIGVDVPDDEPAHSGDRHRGGGHGGGRDGGRDGGRRGGFRGRGGQSRGGRDRDRDRR